MNNARKAVHQTIADEALPTIASLMPRNKQIFLSYNKLFVCSMPGLFRLIR